MMHEFTAENTMSRMLECLPRIVHYNVMFSWQRRVRGSRVFNKRSQQNHLPQNSQIIFRIQKYSFVSIYTISEYSSPVSVISKNSSLTFQQPRSQGLSRSLGREEGRPWERG